METKQIGKMGQMDGFGQESWRHNSSSHYSPFHFVQMIYVDVRVTIANEESSSVACVVCVSLVGLILGSHKVVLS